MGMELRQIKEWLCGMELRQIKEWLCGNGAEANKGMAMWEWS